MITLNHSIKYGINRFVKTTVYEDEDGLTCFNLVGYKNAEKVFLKVAHLKAEEFPMEKTDDGWMYKILLPEGKHNYIFEIDEKDKRDKNNMLHEKLAGFGNSSVYFKPNHTFELYEYLPASKVYLAGNLNQWNPNNLPLTKKDNKWQLSLFLPDGTYVYKFVVDGKWQTDPANPIFRPDGKGNYNSYLLIGAVSVFKLYGYLEAKEVKVAGNFNLWNYAELNMSLTPSGWEIHFALSPGIYEYKFVVDGEWITDPNNPYHFYRQGGRNSLICVKPNHIFKLDEYTDAKEVILTGNFNNWDRSNYRMAKEGKKWVFPMYLPKQKNMFNFIVDGKNLYEKPKSFDEERARMKAKEAEDDLII